MSGVIYRGWIEDDEYQVMKYINGLANPLPLRLELANHSPTGFAWGYNGSGPAQLALALIADASGDDDLALRSYQRFKDLVVARFPGSSSWVMTRTQVLVDALKLGVHHD